MRTQPSRVKIKFTLDNGIWSQCFINVGDKKSVADIGYSAGDGIGLLVRALLFICGGGETASFVFDGEGNKWFWEISKRGYHIKVIFKSFRDVSLVEIDSEVDILNLSQEVSKAAHDLLEENNNDVDIYKQKTGGYEFPSSELSSLDYLIEKRIQYYR